MNGLRALAILTLSGPGEGPLTEIIVYFAVAGFILLCCGVIHPLFRRSYFCRYYLGEVQSNQADSSETIRLLKSDSNIGKQDIGKSLQVGLQVLKAIYPFVLVLIFTYIQTFFTFPGVMLQKPMNMNPDWAIVSMLTVFNFFDVVGKYIAQYRKYYNLRIILLILVSRIIIIVFFVLQARDSNIAVLNTLWFGYITVALCGLTSGFLTTAMFIMGPERVEGEAKQVAGFLSVLGLTLRITLGSLLALPMNNS